jgi:hypothetical protein
VFVQITVRIVIILCFNGKLGIILCVGCPQKCMHLHVLKFLVIHPLSNPLLMKVISWIFIFFILFELMILLLLYVSHTNITF